MPTNTTDEDILKRQHEVERLRQRVQEEESKRDTVLKSSHNDVMAALLDEEEAALKQRLESAKEATKAARESVREAVRTAKGGGTAHAAESDTTDNPTPDGEAVSPTGAALKTTKE